ncbi:MAG: hypothetical protein LKF37_10580 [Lentilactobacillus diolivorans]|jgi:hypothetical protein|uniref:D-alanyl-D-alanine carboxypeptidase n=2 Tax=Lentilactobacillus diolivorans TaxID=179838 RepID=A0A0R1SCQ9_9LACO|nr:hypothetical protein [Lentilactobacillus diolivorans]RRG03788.1 MAG: hypothetical protein DUD34_02540 [Lactobacillus sp.]KRL64069.1 hypothetical protein FC85_GL001335 [Lentilactobacillus diolivorans DSM 14421]MCH4165206.1 hypothetical protein [Lentilactobacillus diolivorans]MDH5105505.1 hypothetical protein [Lentilactobacillus diolivorans]GEP25135.1 hypothetical protein LDI01_27280 [Lentilactobacillus diolivorans]
MKIMKKMFFIGILGLLISCINFTTNPDTTRAAYRIIKSKNYSTSMPKFQAKTQRNAYIWNRNLTKKLHNLKNYPKTVWSVSKSFKMTNGKKIGIFYYVSNSAQTVKGYIWRGYLRRYNFAETSLPLQKQVIDAFPGTIHDPKLQKTLDDMNGTPDEQGEYLRKKLGSQLDELKMSSIDGTKAQIKQLESGQMSYRQYIQRAIPAGFKNATGFEGYTMKDFSGWKIAADVYSKNSSLYGYGIIFLLPPEN